MFPPIAYQALIVVPVTAFAGLSTFTGLSPVFISLITLILILLITLASVAGKIIRDDENEKMQNALIIGVFSGILSIIFTIAAGITNPAAAVAASLLAAVSGPKYLQKHLEKEDKGGKVGKNENKN